MPSTSRLSRWRARIRRVCADDDEFHNYAVGFQAIGIFIALVIGALWSVYLFWTLGQRQRSELEIAKNDVELKKAHIELEALNRAFAEVSLSVSSTRPGPGQAF